ncbi:MAG: glucose/arabinose dehydrogenase, partial [Candidatus Azotimanducaceae bacterium]
AHSAALGMTFYTGSQFPKNYDGALFIAEHGSWNRANKVGYKVSVVTEQDGELVYQPFAEGWLVGEDNWGRPNDVLQTAEGALLISDDQAGAIYKITYEPNL